MPRREDRGKVRFDAHADPHTNLPLVTHDSSHGTALTTRGTFNLNDLTYADRDELAAHPDEPYAVFTNPNGEHRLFRHGSLVWPGYDYTRLTQLRHIDVGIPIADNECDLAEYVQRLRAHAADPAGHPTNCPGHNANAHGYGYGDHYGDDDANWNLGGHAQNRLPYTCQHRQTGHLLADYYDTLIAAGWELIIREHETGTWLLMNTNDGPDYEFTDPRRRR